MTVTVHNNAQLNAILAAMGGVSEATQVTAAEVKAHRDENQTTMKDAKEAVQKEKAEKASKTDPKPDAAPLSEPTPTASDNSASSSTESEAASNTKAATYEDAKKAILALSKEKGRQASVDALARFGAEKLPDLPQERYADLVKLVNEVIAGAEV